MSLPDLNTHIYASPALVRPGSPMVTNSGELISTLEQPDIAHSRFQFSFEQTAERLQQFERVYFEYDGSFVWAGRELEQAWQLYGMLYDFGGSLHRVELKGSCPLETWENLMRVLGNDQQPLVAHLLDQNCFVDTQALKQLW